MKSESKHISDFEDKPASERARNIGFPYEDTLKTKRDEELHERRSRVR